MTAPISTAAPAQRTSALRRYLANPLAVGAAIVLGIIVLACALAPLLTTQDPGFSNIRDSLLPPFSTDHVLGTDGSGRDLLARLLHGGRVSLAGAALALVVAAVIGIPSGLLAGFYGGRFDALSGWSTSLIQSMPGIVVLLAARAVLGPSIWLSMLIFGVILSPGFHRVTRTAVMNVRNELFVDAARVSGLRDSAIIARHILTVVRAPVIIQGSLLLGIALAIQSGLEFLGVGDNAIPSWGNMLNEGFKNIYRAPVTIVWPALAIGLTCAALVIIGNGLRDALEERGTSRAVRRPRATVAPAPTPVTVGNTDVETAAPAAPAPEALLSVRGLQIGYGDPSAPQVVVHDVDLDVLPGEVLGVVGESGSGKTQTAFAVLGLLPAGGRVMNGSIRFEGRELSTLSAQQMRDVRGNGIAYIPQEPMSNLDPSFTVGSQLTDPLRRKLGLGRAEAHDRAIELLARVGIRDPQRTFDAFPHEISGGMAQRALIAGAVSCNPRLLIADEPTTALDVTVQAEVLSLLRDLQSEYSMSVILVTHNFGVVADICDRVAVMKSGTIVEQGTTPELFAHPQHEYTRMLLDSTLEGGPSRIDLDRSFGDPR